MRGEVSGDLLLIGEVTDVRGTKVKVRVYSQANEASVFYHGELVRGVSVGGYLRLPCGYDDVIGVVERGLPAGSRTVASKGADGREAPDRTLNATSTFRCSAASPLGGLIAALRYCLGAFEGVSALA